MTTQKPSEQFEARDHPDIWRAIDSHDARLARQHGFLAVLASYFGGIDGLVHCKAAARAWLAAHPEPLPPEKPADEWAKWTKRHTPRGTAICRYSGDIMENWYTDGDYYKDDVGESARLAEEVDITHAAAVALIPAIAKTHPLPKCPVCLDTKLVGGRRCATCQGPEPSACGRDSEGGLAPSPRPVGEAGHKHCRRCGALQLAGSGWTQPRDGEPCCSECYAPVEEWPPDPPSVQPPTQAVVCPGCGGTGTRSRTLDNAEDDEKPQCFTCGGAGRVSSSYKPMEAGGDWALGMADHPHGTKYLSPDGGCLMCRVEVRGQDIERLGTTLTTRDARIKELESQAETLKAADERHCRTWSDDIVKINATKDARIAELNTMLAERDRTIWARGVVIKQLESDLAAAKAGAVQGVGVSFSDLRAVNVDRVPMFGHTLTGWNPLEWAGAMCGEAGEAANVAKKIRRVQQGCNVNTGGDGVPELVAKLATEIAGTVVYADLCAASVGIDLGQAVAEEFDRVSKRVGYMKTLGDPPAQEDKHV